MSALSDDRLLLRACREALSVPFADPVAVAGLAVPRGLVRALERNLLQILSDGGLPALGPVAEPRGLAIPLPSPARHLSPSLTSG